MTSTRVILSVVVGALSTLAGCSCGPVCGEGTELIDGECVATGDGNEGEGEEGEGEEGEGEEGEGEEGEGEGEGLVCGPGTVVSVDGASCVPACREDQVFEAGACACPAGTIDQPGFGCELDPALCADGTVLSNEGLCEPLEAPPRDDDDVNAGAPTVVLIPDIGEKGPEFGGVIDRPGDELDTDTFTFDGVAGMRLRIELVSFGAESASFAVAGTAPDGDETGIANYIRFGLPGGGRRALRDVVLPLTGAYQIIVADKATFAGGLPAGGDDQTYALIVEQIAEPAPSTLIAATEETGLHDSIESFRFDPASLDTDLVDVALESSDVNTAHLLWFVTEDGEYVEFGAANGDGGPIAAFVPQIAVGTVVHVDYLFHGDPPIGPTTTFTLEANPLEVLDGPGDGVTDTIDTEGDQLTFVSFDLDVSRVYRFIVELPLTSSQDVGVLLVNEDLQVIGQCTPGQNDAGRETHTCIRFIANEVDAGEHFIVVVNQAGEPVVGIENNQLRVTFDEAPVSLVTVNPTGDTVAEAATADVSDDDFGAPWFRVIFGAPLALTADGPTFDVHDDETGALIEEGLDAIEDLDGVEQRGGFGFLIRPRATGTITLTGAALPYVYENEAANNVATGALAIPADADDDLPAGSAGGFIDTGDVDFWSVDVARAGVLTVSVTDAFADEGPFEEFQLLGGEVDGDAFVEFVDNQGTSLSDPGVTTSLFFEEPTTALVRVTLGEIEFFGFVFPGFPGDYGLSFSFDDEATAPSTCADPTLITTSTTEPIRGDLTRGPRTAAHQPADDTCFGFDPGFYDGGEDAYAVTIPAGGSLVASVNATFDAAIAVIDGDSCGTGCTVGADAADGLEEVQFANPSDVDARTVLVVVESFGGGGGGYTLDVQLFGSVCRVGESRCTGANRETCNATGTAFDSRECLEGCAFDSFDQVATCNVECGPGTPRPIATCDGADIQACQNGFVVETACPVACTDDPAGAVCSFGVCAPNATVCGDIDVDNDGTPEGVAETVCNALGSEQTIRACASGSCDGTACGEVPTFVAPANGVCDALAVPLIDGSGTFVGNVDGSGNDFVSGAVNDNCARGGTDVFWRLDTTGRPAGSTVTIRTNNIGDATVGILDVTDGNCTFDGTSCVAFTDVGFDGDPETLVFTVPATPFVGLVLVDSFAGDDLADDLAVEVTFSADLVEVCDGSAADVCAGNELDSCAANELTQSTRRCEFGCNVDGDACDDAVLGESCDDPLAVRFPVPGETIQIPTDISGFAGDLEGGCGGDGEDGVFSFVADFDADLVITHSGFDGVLYVSEGTCGGTNLDCNDGFSTDTIEFSVLAGEEYFVVLDTFDVGGAGPTVLSMGFAP